MNFLFKCNVNLFGSWVEGIKIGFLNEFDYKWILVNFNEIFILEEIEVYFLGYIRLWLWESEVLNYNLMCYVDIDGFLDSRNLICDFYMMINDVIFSGGIIVLESFYFRKYLKVDKGFISKLVFCWVGILFKDLLIEVDIVLIIKLLLWIFKCIEVNYFGFIIFLKESKINIVFKMLSLCLVKNWNVYFCIFVFEYEV